MILTSGRDKNGNKIVRVKVEVFQGFSIQTNGSLPHCHASILGINSFVCWNEVREYVRKYGTRYQKKVINSEV